MKIKHYIYFGTFFALTLVSCKNEDPFSYDFEEGTGRILTSGISVEVKTEEASTRAAVPDTKDFIVSFCEIKTPNEPYQQFTYSDMPEVVILPVGEYVVKAYYGDDSIVADFDAPAYYGESQTIKVENGKIYEVTDPLICTLYNVRVSVSFDEELKKVMGDDVKVSVEVGESGSLDFTAKTQGDGFFRYDENSNTLAATFSGTVNGAKITEIKNYDNVKRGTYYHLSFKLHGVEIVGDEPGVNPGPTQPNQPEEEPGNTSGNIIIDASVTFKDHSSEGGLNVDPEREEYLEDERFPNSGGNPGTEEPDDNPQQPENPGEQNELPSLVSDDVDLSTTTDISNWAEGQSLAVKILTPTKLSKFVCTIDSSTLTPEELESVYLKSELDLINDTDLFEDLSGLGFPVGEDITNPKEQDENGNYVIIFDITQFVKMLNALGEGTHNFIFDLVNEAGETIQTLKLKS